MAKNKINAVVVWFDSSDPVIEKLSGIEDIEDSGSPNYHRIKFPKSIEEKAFWNESEAMPFNVDFIYDEGFGGAILAARISPSGSDLNKELEQLVLSISEKLDKEVIRSANMLKESEGKREKFMSCVRDHLIIDDFAKLRHHYFQVSFFPDRSRNADRIFQIKKEMAGLMIKKGLYPTWPCSLREAPVGTVGALCPSCNKIVEFFDDDGDRHLIAEKPETFGNHLVMKDGKRGKFWGCENFPKCKFTRSTAEILSIESRARVLAYAGQYGTSEADGSDLI